MKTQTIIINELMEDIRDMSPWIRGITPPTPVHGDPFSCDYPAMAELEIFDYEMVANDQAYYEFMQFTNPNATL